MKKIAFFGIFLSLIAVFIYFYFEYKNINKNIIVKVGDLVITKNEFEQELKYRTQNYVLQIDKKALLDEMIQRKLVLNQAYKLKLDKDPKIQREFENLLVSKLKNRYLIYTNEDVNISESEIRNFYEKHKSDFLIPEKDYFAILFFRKNQKDENQKEFVLNKLKDIWNLAKNNQLPAPEKGFGKYAISYSEHQASRYRGGSIGGFYKNNRTFLEPEVLEAGFNLTNVGDISALIETKKGFYLVRLMKRRLKRYLDFENAKWQIYQKLFLEKQKLAKDNFYDSLYKSFDIEFNMNNSSFYFDSSSFEENKSNKKFDLPESFYNLN
jgi:peptidyl-prolyl cis-trans isomerase C